jgi:very-short-patch-repair endonuclease
VGGCKRHLEVKECFQIREMVQITLSPFEGGWGDVNNYCMPRNKILWYNPALNNLARQLRLNSTKAEIIMWKYIKGKVLGWEFHRQRPVDEYILDFYCNELKLAIEIDGYTHDFNYDKDLVRQTKLERLGIRVIRFSDEDVKKHLNDVIRALQFVILEMTEDTSPRPPSKGEVGNEDTSPRPRWLRRSRFLITKSGIQRGRLEMKIHPRPPSKGGQLINLTIF